MLHMICWCTALNRSSLQLMLNTKAGCPVQVRLKSASLKLASSLLGLILVHDPCCRQPLTFEQFFQPRQQVTTTAIRWAWPLAVLRSI